MIYAFLNQKGGVGKTTLSIHTAAELARQRRRVLLIDADPQGSSLAWANGREKSGFQVIGIPKATLHKQIEELAKDFDDVVIDGPPRIAELARSILLACDVVVIPLLPSQLDVWAAAETIDLIREAEVINPDLKSCLVINRKITNTAIGRDVRETLRELDIPVLKADIAQRVAFAESLAAGETVQTKSLSKAAREVKRFVQELKRIK